MGVQHPVDVVVRGDQQRRRVVEWDVVGQPLRRHVAVRRDDRQILDTLVQLPGDRAETRLGGQQPIRVKPQL